MFWKNLYIISRIYIVHKEIKEKLNMQIRNIVTEDYFSVISVLNDWWGGRQMNLLPRLFFEHFQNTSYIMEKDEELVAFLIGFVSQTDPNIAYIHFVGVNPNFRKQGLANHLYNLFTKDVKALGCKEIHCITSPINTVSINFHKAMNFEIQLCKNYAGKGQDRICFSKSI